MSATTLHAPTPPALTPHALTPDARTSAAPRPTSAAPRSTSARRPAPDGRGVDTTRVRLPLSLVVLLGALTAVPSLSLDFYLPALPTIARETGSGQATAQLTITACLVGFALGLLVAGPLSDAHGRRRPLLAGVAVYTVASLACAFAPTIEVLIALRVVQGAAGAFGMVTGSAIVRDRASGTAAAKLFSVLMLANGVAPILGPVLGAQLLVATDWRGLFVALAVVGTLMFAAARRWLPETLPADRRRPASVGGAGRTFAFLLHDRPLVGYTLGRAFGASALVAYVAASPFVFQQVYGLSAQGFGLVFGVNSVGLIAMGQLSGRLVGRFGSAALLRTGSLVSASGSVVLLVVLAARAPLPLVLVAVFAVVAGMGMVFPNSTALGLTRHGSCAGATTALMGVVQFLTQAVASPLTGLGSGTSAMPMAVVVFVFCAAGLVSLLTLTRERVSPPVREVVVAQAA